MRPVVVVLIFASGAAEALADGLPDALSSEAEADLVRAVLQLDVFTRYVLTRKYPTPLQQRGFRKTKDYQRLLATLRAERTTLRESTARVCGVAEIEPYDLRRHELPIVLSYTALRPGNTPKEFFEGFWFPSLPIKEEEGRANKPGYHRRLLVPAAEQQALAVERANRSSVCFEFVPSSVRTYKPGKGPFGVKIAEVAYPVGRKVQIVVMDGAREVFRKRFD
jgi:hypothetical protein